MPDNEKRKEWTPRFNYDTAMPPLTEKDLRIIKFREKQRRENAVHMRVVDTFKKLTDRGLMTKDGFIDVQKSKEQTNAELNELVRKILRRGQ